MQSPLSYLFLGFGCLVVSFFWARYEIRQFRKKDEYVILKILEASVFSSIFV